MAETATSVKGMHVPHDWQLFMLPTGRKYIKTVCGVVTKPKYIGIPTLSHNQFGDSGNAYGWCPKCIAGCIDRMLGLGGAEMPKNIREQYRRVFRYSVLVMENFLTAEYTNPFVDKTQGPTDYARWEVQQYKTGCYLCGVSGGSTPDHILPRSMGGPDELWNLALVHKPCNDKKADLSPWHLGELFPDHRLPQYFLDKSI